MLIGQLATRTGVSAKALRFYERRGLLPEPDRTSGGYRDYGADAVTRVTFIKDAQGSGFTLAQIGEVFAIRDAGDPPCAHVADLIDERLADVQRRLAELTAVRDQLRDLATRASGFDPSDCDGFCGIITARSSGGEAR